MSKQYPTTITDPFKNSSYRKMNNKNPSSTKFAITGIGIRPIGKYQHPRIKTLIFDYRLEIHMNIIKKKLGMKMH